MPFELQAVVWTTLILFVLIGLQGSLVPLNQGIGWGLGARDEANPGSVVQQRLVRTVGNHIQGMLLFVPLVLVAHAAGVSSELTVLGAWLYLIGRALFAPAYLMGIYAVRTVIWAVSLIGIGLIGFEVMTAMLG